MSFPAVVIQRGIFFSAIIMQIYDTYKKGHFNPPVDYRFADFIGAKNFPVMGSILESKKEIIVAFRGTENFTDLFEDLNIVPASYSYAQNAGLVPKGFLDVYSSIRSQLFQSIKRLPRNKPFYITGHSLGGALARLFALDLSTNTPFKNPLVLTLASPRVGNEDFISLFNRSIMTNYGIYNKHDPVPFLPPAFKHVQKEVPISFLYRNPLHNHQILHYYHYLSLLSPSFSRMFCKLNPHFCRKKRKLHE